MRSLACLVLVVLGAHLCAGEGDVVELADNYDAAHDAKRQEADLPPPTGRAHWGRGDPNVPTPWMNPKEGVVSAVPRNAFPNKIALRGAEGARLHDAGSLIAQLKNAGEWQAEKYPYPGNGKMNAADAAQMIGLVRGPLNIIKAAAEAEYKAGEEELAAHKRAADALIASIKGGPKGTRLLSGALSQQLGILKGNVGNCNKRLVACRAPARVLLSSDPLDDLGPDTSLRPTRVRPCYEGEGVDCTAAPTTTAMEDYNKMTGQENEFVAAEKARGKLENVKRTAYQDYAKSQTGGAWDRLDGEPGMKLPQDRLPASHLKSMVAETANVIARQEALDKQEDEKDLAKVEEAGRKAVDVVKSTTKANMDLLKFYAPRTTQGMLDEMKVENAKLNTCMEEVLKVCQDGKPFEVAEAASTTEEVLNKHPNPRDSPEYNPSEGALSPKVMTKGGEGGSKPISPGQDATDVPQ
jgi:hypothetical protein